MINKPLTLFSILFLLLIYLTGCSEKEVHNSSSFITTEGNIQEIISEEDLLDIEISENYMKIDNWDLTVVAVEMFHAPGSLKNIGAKLLFTNLEGRDKSFTPTGKITAYIGTSGKDYRDFKYDTSLQNLYQVYKQSAKGVSEREAGGVPYEEGVSKLALPINVNAIETGIIAIIYTDKKGVEHKIPISIETTILVPSPDAK